MNKRKRIITAIVAALLALLMIVPIIITIVSSVSASATPYDELDELRAEADRLAERRYELQSTIQALENERNATMSKKVILDEQIEITRGEIRNTNSQIELLELQILDKEAEYERALDEEARQYEIFKERVRAMEENGSISYFSIIFEARDFGDFLSRLDFISEIMAYDESIVNDLEAAQAVTIQHRTELESAKLDVEDYYTQLLEKENELQLRLAESLEFMRQLEENKAAYELVYLENLELEAQVDLKIDEKIAEIEEIERIEAEEAAARAAAEQSAAAGSGSTGGGSAGSIVSTGTYIWPSNDSAYITSFFGGRMHPILGYYTNHNGADIGASYGTEILAADSGLVVTAEYHYSYGNYVMIAHGGGRYTLYAHMSEIAVWEDESVYQGQVIGYVGSTGYSTGPHLHFEIRVDGVRVDPLDYFDNWYY